MSKPTVSKLTPEQLQQQQWNQLHDELCYRIFFGTEDGKKYLAMMESRYFRQPVANPNQDSKFAYWNDGFNECIRSKTAGMLRHMQRTELAKKKEEDNRPATSPGIKPIKKKGEE